MDEIPEDVKSQVLESSCALLASSEDTEVTVSSQDLETACPIIEDPPLEESCESETEELEYAKVDEFIARELEDLMSKLHRPNMGDYRIGGVPGKGTQLGFVPWDELVEGPEDELIAQPLQHRSL